MTAHLVVELVCGILEAVIEIVSRGTLIGLDCECAFESLGADLLDAGREDYALTFLYRHLKVTGHIKVLIELISALQLLGVFKLAVPVGTEHKLTLLAELHEQLGVSGIHGGGYTVLNLAVLTAGVAVLMSELAHAAECQERLESQCGLRVAVHQGISYKYAVFVVLKEFLLLEQHTAHAIYGGRHLVTVEFTYVFMALGAEIVTPVLMQSKVELGAVLNDRFIQ